VLTGKVTVSHSHGECFVAHDFRDRSDIHFSHDEAARTGMSERVADNASNPGFLENRNIISFTEVLRVNVGVYSN